MTKEEVQASSQKKVDEVQALITKLELLVTAEQMLTPQGFIKFVVYYTDTEKYDVDEEQVTSKKDETNSTKKN